MKRSMRKLNGSALVIALLAISALLTVGLGIARLIPNDFRTSLALESSINAESAAWAGVEHALLLLKQNNYYELTESTGRPFGTYIKPSRSDEDCDLHRNLDRCKGIDRQLGTPVNQSPKFFTTLGGSARYGLTIWHRRHNVGNTNSVVGSGDGLDDGLPTALNKSRNAANSNPTLDRDEVRRLDVRDTKVLILTWKAVQNDNCNPAKDQGTSLYLLYSLLDDQNTVLQRKELSIDTQRTGQIIPVAGATTLSLRFLATNPDQSKVSDCFIRYSLQNDTNDPNDTVDMGIDVIDSVGESGNVRRKIRVLVNRENGRLINIFDFGLACDTCQGI